MYNTTTENETPRIYVADLAAYNNGKLHGVWVDATQDIDTIWDEVNKMLKNSPEGFAEEYAIHDFEGFGTYRMSEYEGLERTNNIALFIQEHGDVGLAALAYYNDLEDAKTAVEDNYHGCHDSEEAFAEELYTSCYEIPEHLEYYIDYAKIARDLFMGDYFAIKVGYQIHVFSCH